MELNILLSKAHAEFRKLRSGELGDNLRAQGIDYKIIWGLESYKLKGIAEYIKSEVEGQRSITKSLALVLWKEDVRESKMLATRLYPIDEMDEATAAAWASEVRYTELADQLSMNLLSKLDYAPELAKRWIEGTEMQQYIAIQLILRLELEALYPQAEDIANNDQKPMWLRATATRCSQSF